MRCGKEEVLSSWDLLRNCWLLFSEEEGHSSEEDHNSLRVKNPLQFVSKPLGMCLQLHS